MEIPQEPLHRNQQICILPLNQHTTVSRCVGRAISNLNLCSGQGGRAAGVDYGLKPAFVYYLFFIYGELHDCNL